MTFSRREKVPARADEGFEWRPSVAVSAGSGDPRRAQCRPDRHRSHPGDLPAL